MILTTETLPAPLATQRAVTTPTMGANPAGIAVGTIVLSAVSLAGSLYVSYLGAKWAIKGHYKSIGGKS